MENITNSINNLADKINSLSIGIKTNNTKYFLTTIIPIGISFLALGLTVFFRIFDNRLLKYNRFIELMNEYRSKEMGDCIKYLWDTYNNYIVELDKKGLDCDYHSDLVHEQTIQMMVNKKNVESKRRFVSQFFALLANHYLNKKIPKKDVEALWGKDNLKILAKIIIPMEIAVAETIGNTNNNTINNLNKFYNCLTKQNTYSKKHMKM